MGTLAAGPSSNTIGRKWTYILGVCGSLGVGYALIAAAQNRWMLHLGRFLHGNALCLLKFSLPIKILWIHQVNFLNYNHFYFCTLGIGLGVSTTVATVYTMEIATPNMRGRLAVIPAIGKILYE